MEFSRQPRVVPEYRIGEIKIDMPPMAEEKPEIQWFQTFAPSLVMLGVTFLMYLASKSGNGGFMSNPVFLIGSAAGSVVALIGGVISINASYGKYKKSKKTIKRRYSDYIKDKESELNVAKMNQSSALLTLYPAPNEKVAQLSPKCPKLWERTPNYEDFLGIRLGIGTCQAALRGFAGGEPGILNNDPLAYEPEKLALRYQTIDSIPVCLDLRNAQICGVAGKLEFTDSFASNMLLQLAANCGYDDLRIVIISDRTFIEKRNWVGFLPHVWNNDRTSRYLLSGESSFKKLLAEIGDDLKERERRGVEASIKFHYLFLIQDRGIIENEPIRKYIFEPNASIGVISLFISDSVTALPSQCGAVINFNKEKTAELSNRVNKNNNTFTPDVFSEKGVENAVRSITSIKIKSLTSNYSLPTSITLTELLNVSDLSQFDSAKKWESNRPYNGMGVPIGVKSNGSPLYFDLHEKGHGPHGLVAGTTGSGKSELLQTIIVSLAFHYHPYDIQFVLIDYKGGGMADVFKGMPHLAGIITNLGGNQTTRALMSIKGENHRRERLFAKYGVNNIDKYQRLYHRKEIVDMPPIPHLVIIADEFAELMREQHEFMQELVSVARVGRSLGIHLILATQKPDGVVDDQIWSNSKFKLCLKVQTEQDSNGVLKNTDAAYIKEPGRAYIQIGNNEMYDLFQSAYSGAEYILPNEVASEASEVKIYEVYLDGKTEKIYPKPESEQPDSEKTASSQLEVSVARIIESASDIDMTVVLPPWTEPLSSKLYLNSLDTLTAKNDKYALSAIVGIADDPSHQCKFPLEIDFSNNGNLLIYGASGTGKGYFLRTLCLSLALKYNPSDVNIYIIDMNDAGLKRAFRNLPHCGGVLTVQEESEIRQFARFLINSVDERKKSFEEKDVDNFSDYKKSGGSLPAMIVVVDNYFALSETYEDVDTQFNMLVRDGSRFGMYFVVTFSNTMNAKYKFTINFKTAITFQLVDESEYSVAVGRTDGLKPENFQGRGLVKLDTIYEFQSALPEERTVEVTAVDEREMETENITDCIAIINRIAESTTEKAIPIPIMPESISLSKINGDITGMAFNVGLYDNDLSIANVDLSEHVAFVVTGDTGCGKSTLLCAWVKLLKHAKVYTVDSNSSGLFSITELKYVTDIGTQISDKTAFAQELVKIIKDRREERVLAKKSGKTDKEYLATVEPIVFVLDKVSEFSENPDFENLVTVLEQIVRRGHGLGITILAADSIDGLSRDYSEFAKAVKNESTGIMLGSLKDQMIFNVNMPYSTIEKEFVFGDGYLVKKTRFTGIRVGL